MIKTSVTQPLFSTYITPNLHTVQVTASEHS